MTQPTPGMPWFGKTTKPNSGMPEFGLRRLNQKLAPEIDPVSERWRFR